jgi:DNA-binding GntR family transcriptional regulator
MKDTDSYIQTASDLVYHKLRAQIIAKKRRPGERLPEETIARELDVSRTPVREAIRRLATEGLVTLIPNAGARLANPSRREIIDTYEVREYLECLAARKAAVNITEAQASALQSAIDEEEKIFEQKNFEDYLEINNRFHHTLAESSGNAVLASYIVNLLARTSVFMIFYDSFFDMKTNPSLDEHRALLKALLAHEPDRAEQLMKVHLMLSATSLKSNEGLSIGKEQ